MSKIEETVQFDAYEMSIIAKALALFLNERSRAFELAVEIASEKGQASPDHEDFGLTTILRLSRRCASYHPRRDGSRTVLDVAQKSLQRTILTNSDAR